MSSLLLPEYLADIRASVIVLVTIWGDAARTMMITRCVIEI
jgi:hypothetical protein